MYVHSVRMKKHPEASATELYWNDSDSFIAMDELPATVVFRTTYV
jgi:hypothetical protein